MKRIHKFHSPFNVVSQIFGGATLIRALFNETIKSYSLSGSVLALGSKSQNSSYYQYINVDDDCKITFTDLVPSDGVTVVDVQERLPFEDNSFDMVLAFHLFEHVYDYHTSVNEIFRILKPGGKFIISMPFMHKYHADPDDYYRFTDSAIVRIWEEGGLNCSTVEYVGEGIYTSFLTTMTRFRSPKYLSRLLQGLMYLSATMFDRVINIRQKKKNKKTLAQQYALEFVVSFTK
jgi:SAM-dependent methyltransferase